MGIANIINNSTTTSGGEIVRELVNSTDGSGLHLQNGGSIALANGAAQFGTSDFSLEFILDQKQENTSEGYIYVTHVSGANRLLIFHDVSDDRIVLDFRDSSGTSKTENTKYLAYDMNQDFGSPTHYVITFDRSEFATLYKNGNSVASVNISSTSAIDIGNSSGSKIGSTGTDGVIGTFYRFRTFNTLADAKLLSERADVPQTLTANLLVDLDLAFANPTQSLTVQNRAGAPDGEASASGVTQVQKLVQGNLTSLAVTTTSQAAGVPADGAIVADNVSVGGATAANASADGDDLVCGSTTGAATGASIVSAATGNGSIFFTDNAGYKNQGQIKYDHATDAMTVATNTAVALTIDSSGNCTFNSDDVLITSDNSGKPVLTIRNQFSDASGPELVLERDQSYEDNNDILGTVRFKGYNNSNAKEEYATIYAQSTNVVDGAEDGQMIFRTMKDGTLAARLTIGSDGLATFSNGIALQTAASNDSATANEAYTLDKYETGTFTASLTAATTPPTSVPTTTGNYTRVGNMVKIQIRFDNDDISGAVGAMKITGLPFTAASNNESNFDPVSAIFYGLPYSNSVGYVAGGTSEIVFYNQVNNSAWTAYNVDYSSTSGAGKFLFINATYTV
jgi:hypothetical protein